MGRISSAWQALTGSKRDLASDQIGWLERGRAGGAGRVRVTGDSALRHSAVWACLRLRADLISTLPVDSFRKVGGVQVEVAKPGWLDEPYPGVDITDWMWGSQVDLDRYGNSFGLITKRDGAGRLAEVEPLPAGETSVITTGRRITQYRVNGEVIPPELIWHERQYRPAGCPLGLSPIAYAAWSIGGYLSAQQFALDWYSSGAMPSGTLENTEIEVDAKLAQEAKARFKASVENRDLFVHGKSWKWTPAEGDAHSAAFLDEMRYGIADVCRFLGVPGDMIDAESSTGSITYANVTQRNVQLLVVNLGPAINRRERAFSRALAKPRFVKLNAAAVLRMDPETRSRVLSDQVTSRRLAPSEARALEDRQPFTDAQLGEFDRLFGAPKTTPTTAARWAPPYAIEVRDLPRAAIGSGWVVPGEVMEEA